MPASGRHRQVVGAKGSEERVEPLAYVRAGCPLTSRLGAGGEHHGRPLDKTDNHGARGASGGDRTGTASYLHMHLTARLRQGRFSPSAIRQRARHKRTFSRHYRCCACPAPSAPDSALGVLVSIKDPASLTLRSQAQPRLDVARGSRSVDRMPGMGFGRSRSTSQHQAAYIEPVARQRHASGHLR
jgi:hypothetical protein